jgi:hypothetical protein
MFKDIIEHTGKDRGPIEVRDNVDLARRVAFLLRRAQERAKRETDAKPVRQPPEESVGRPDSVH